MSIPSKWRIFALTLPLTILFGMAKLLFHQQGWELWTFNALTSSLFGAATFIIAFQLNGTLSDYRSSDSLLTQFCVSIESIQDSNLLTAKIHPEYDPQALHKSLLSLTKDLRDVLQSEQPLQPLLMQTADLNSVFADLEKYAIGSSMSLVQTEQGKLRGILMQIKGVRDSDFIEPAYALLELFTIASTIALLLIGSEEITESIVVSSLLFVVFLYLLLLIKDLDNPFQYGGFSSVDSSLQVLDESIDRLGKQAITQTP
jgi:hypothetical protein